MLLRKLTCFRSSRLFYFSRTYSIDISSRRVLEKSATKISKYSRPLYSGHGKRGLLLFDDFHEHKYKTNFSCTAALLLYYYRSVLRSSQNPFSAAACAVHARTAIGQQIDRSIAACSQVGPASQKKKKNTWEHSY